MALPGSGQATVSWLAPLKDGGKPIDSYRVTPYLNGVGQTPITFVRSAIRQVIGSLTNGATYTFKVAAHSQIGWGSQSAASGAIVVGAPTAPRSVTAVPGNAQATVSWTVPVSSNASSITGYTVTPYVAGVAEAAHVFSSTATTETVTGLTNGTAYTFKVAATNGSGTGPQSAGASAAIVVGAPTAPRSVTAVPGNAQATVSWTVPVSSNASSITGYTVTPYVAGVAQAAHVFSSTATTETVTGLTNGTAYTFKVAATNGSGTGPQSAGASAAIVVGAPTAPRSVTAVPGNAQATVSWTVPVSSNASSITGYTVTPYVAGVAQAAHVFSSTATTETVTGLTNGTAYTFKVAATNGSGTGPQSAASGAITPT